MRVRRPLVATLALASIAALAACSGAGAKSASTSSQNPNDQKILDYVSCLRAHGATVPDPTRDSNGNLRLRLGGGVRGNGTPNSGSSSSASTSGNANRQALQSAIQTCGTPPTNGGGNGPGNRNPAAFAAFAQCMQQHGVTVPSTPPDSSGSPGSGGPGGRGGFLNGLDRNDPNVQAALQACRQQLPNGGRFGGASSSSSST